MAEEGVGEMNLKLEITNFLNYLTIERGCSDVTIKNYKGHLENLSKFMKNKELNIDTIREYRIYLSKKALNKSTQNAYLIALRSFLKYLTKMNILILSLDSVKLIKTEERQIKMLTPAQMSVLLSQPNTKRFGGTRDRAIMETLFATGLRVSELCSLNRNELNFQTGDFSVKGKGGRVRPIFISDRALKWINRYLMKRKDESPALFIASKGNTNRLQPRVVQKLVKKHALKAGLTERITPHVMRHLFACDLLSNGADLRSIQELLGHKNLATTQVYTHVTNPQLKKIYMTFHGKDLWL